MRGIRYHDHCSHDTFTDINKKVGDTLMVLPTFSYYGLKYFDMIRVCLQSYQRFQKIFVVTISGEFMISDQLCNILSSRVITNMGMSCFKGLLCVVHHIRIGSTFIMLIFCVNIYEFEFSNSNHKTPSFLGNCMVLEYP